MTTITSSQASIVANVNRLTDDDLVDLATTIDDTADLIQHLAMRPMDEFNDTFNDTAAITIAEYVKRSPDFDPTDAYFAFRATRELTSTDEATYVETLRKHVDELAEAVEALSDVLDPAIVERLCPDGVAE